MARHMACSAWAQTCRPGSHARCESPYFEVHMKRAVLIVGVAALATTPAAAQWRGMPVWNSPKGGTGVTISGDFGQPNDAYGAGTAWGGRASVGLGTLTLTPGVRSYQSDTIGPPRVTSYGRPADLRLLGGSPPP